MKRMVLGLALAMGLSSVSMIASAEEKPAAAAPAKMKDGKASKKSAAAKTDKKVEAQKAKTAPMKSGGAAASNKMEGGE